MDDGTEVSVEPDIKAVSTVLSIIDRRARLLGMEQNNLNVRMDVQDSTQSNLRAVLAGAPGAVVAERFDAEAEAKKLLAIMRDSGVIEETTVNKLLGDLPALSNGSADDEDEVEGEEIHPE